jgi:hypothetical protein
MFSPTPIDHLCGCLWRRHEEGHENDCRVSDLTDLRGGRTTPFVRSGLRVSHWKTQQNWYQFNVRELGSPSPQGKRLIGLTQEISQTVGLDWNSLIRMAGREQSLIYIASEM